jgi:hypothetical protein
VIESNVVDKVVMLWEEILDETMLDIGLLMVMVTLEKKKE